MTNNGWRTVVAENGYHIFTRDGNLCLESGEDIKTIPIAQISTLMIACGGSDISAHTMVELTKNNAKIIFCDEKHNPHCEVTAYNSNCLSSEKLSLQASWSEKRKGEVWRKIVCDKISAEISLVKTISEEAASYLAVCRDEVLASDSTNREAQAARVYFNTLFGKSFRRRTPSDINSALNYGYAVLTSTVNRFVVIYGYSTALGIKHHNLYNHYNLSCDIMEPFRTVIDEFVCKNRDRDFDYLYKRELVALFCKTVIFRGVKTSLNNAIEQYSKEILDMLSEGSGKEECIGA